MAEVTKPIKAGNVWTNLISGATGESVNFEEVTEWIDGTPMDDSKVDGVIYRKLPISVGGGYVKRVFSDGLINVKWFGAIGDELSDDTAAIQAAVDVAADLARASSFGPNTRVYFPTNNIYATYDTISIPASLSVEMIGRVRYRGVQDRPAFIIGQAGVVNRASRLVLNVNSIRTSDWAESEFVGVRLINTTAADITVTLIDGFYKGLECLGDGSGFAYNQITLQTINSNKYGVYLDYRNGGWCNENVFYGGRFQTSSDFNPGKGRVGVRLTGDDNRFYSPSFELNWTTTNPEYAQAAIFDDAIQCKIIHCRCEGNSNQAIAGGGYSFECNGTSIGNQIEVAYTWLRQRGRERNAFIDNSTTKQNRYYSVENAYADAQFGTVIFNSGNLGRKFVSTDSEVGTCSGVLFVSRSGDISDTSPAGTGVTVKAIGTTGNSIPSIEVFRTAIAVRVNTQYGKKFSVLRDSLNGRSGQVGVKCYDANWNEITTASPVLLDSPVGDDSPNQTFSYSTEYGGCYLTATPAPADLPVYFSVKEEVKNILLLIGSPLSRCTISSFQIRSMDNTGKAPAVDNNTGYQEDGNLRVLSLPTYGTLHRGQVLFARNPAIGFPAMYSVTASGTQHSINVTGDYASGTTITNISDINALTPGDYITVATWASAQLYITAVDYNNNTITVNTSAGAVPGTGLTITNAPATVTANVYNGMAHAAAAVPEGVTEGNTGAIYHRRAQSNLPHPLYVKTVYGGNTGWKYLLTEDDRVSAASADSASAVSSDYDQAEVQAILDELRDLKTKMRAAGLLAT